MKKWTVIGIDLDDDDTWSMVVEAETANDAARTAARQYIRANYLLLTDNSERGLSNEELKDILETGEVKAQYVIEGEVDLHQKEIEDETR